MTCQDAGLLEENYTWIIYYDELLDGKYAWIIYYDELLDGDLFLQEWSLARIGHSLE